MLFKYGTVPTSYMCQRNSLKMSSVPHEKKSLSSSAVAFHPRCVIYLSAELKTRRYNRDYAEEALKAFNQRPRLSDTQDRVQISDGDLVVSLLFLRYIHRNRKREARLLGSLFRHGFGAGISAADDKSEPVFRAFK